MLARRTLLALISLSSFASILRSLRNASSLEEAAKNFNLMQAAQAQNLPINYVNVLEFGTLTIGLTNDSNTIATNTATIQSAIDSVGKIGGGNIYIPSGIYQIAPPSLTVKEPSSLIINYDNIVLFGDGIGKTILHSSGDYSVIDGNVVRGHGIMIQGTLNPRQPRKNVVIRNLELSGGTNGFTGNNKWPADPLTGDGWDLSHKGIVLDFNTSLDNITIDSVYVHDFRGEVIYGGGDGIQKVIISNSKLHGSNGALLSIEADLIVTNCEFSQTATAWVENAALSPNKSHYFDNCIFQDSTYHGLVLTLGKFPALNKHIITNCSFSKSLSGVCAFDINHVLIKDNVFRDCDSALLTSRKNNDIEFLNNKIIGENHPTVTANLTGENNNIYIYNNTHFVNEKLEKTACIFYFGELQNIVIGDNKFENCRTPEQSASLTNERPLFRNNQYINVERRELQGIANFWQSPPYIIEPKCEEIVVLNNTGNSIISVDMSTKHYVNGQEILIVGGASDAQVKFPQNSTTVKCHGDRYLSGKGERLRLKFQKSDLTWYEVSYDTSM
ncbi:MULTISPECIES: right-handed parallel beta-helix repeat-containing protein [Nostocales]|uniref:Pectate lyase superfamily protein domain-containing protein n=3 Tax=Nostocales TaxID=1161 RepID=A0A0C1NAP2_9CYAN|nr:right-handed parallel beta-helix repeat-containing protein [Tolypothrix bouteillei]KAF3884592.1 hypothetical protein DA73_0400003205 [Tolypothrix bouteillei VB521301]